MGLTESGVAFWGVFFPKPCSSAISEIEVVVVQRQSQEQDNDRVAFSNSCVFSDMKH